MIDIAQPAPLNLTAKLKGLVESRGFNIAITTVIVINALVLGLETSPHVMAAAGPLLLALDAAALWVFTVEIGLKLWLYRGRFFREGWPDCPERFRGDIRRAVADWLASMTDRYALRLWQDLFIPRRWGML